MTVDLLRVEIGVIWRLDGRGRLPGPEELVIGVAADGMTAAVRADVPDPVATELLDLVSQAVPSPPGHPPDVLARCAALLGGGREVSGDLAVSRERSVSGEQAVSQRPPLSGGQAVSEEPPVPDKQTVCQEPPASSEQAVSQRPPLSGGQAVSEEPLASGGQAVSQEPSTSGEQAVSEGPWAYHGHAVSGGPCYLVRPPLRFDAPAHVIRSDDPSHATRLRPLRPANWEPEEWDELLAGGASAPWAMIVEDGQVAAICHSARLTPEGAEAGTWTAPAFRGRGYAAATTAAWAALLPDVRLFYSTGADNHSSQRVAGRLGLDAIGWLWKLTPHGSTASQT
ncbi:GNAT family N-acetyltransferase [Nonomuraea jabiensis]|uniref:GNAT family N-acetyltransferase n=1 Tax=Nonomuraea jabiensis TaxID=882448 RepID=UPI003D740DB2